MSEDKDEKSEEKDDLLSMVDSLLDSSEEKVKETKTKEESQGTPKKTKVVPIIIRPPKKDNLESTKITPSKAQIESTQELIKPKLVTPPPIQGVSTLKKESKTTSSTLNKATIKKDEIPKPTREISLEELADTVLGELDIESNTSEIEVPKFATKKIEYKVEPSSDILETEESKTNIPSSYKVKFGTHKKIESIDIDKNIEVECPKCKYTFESLESEDIICPNCHYIFNL